jgi:iron complex transport system substrate-binding protein
MTVTDATGRTVTLAKVPERIASVAPSNTEILYALGLGDRVVSVDEFSDYPPEAQAKATAGSYLKPNLEGLVAARPDVVLATASHGSSLVPALEERGIPTIMLEPKTLPEVFDSIEAVGRMTGRTAEATALAGRLRQRADTVSARYAGQPRPRTYLELSPQLHSAGPGTFLNDLLERAGGANVAASAGTSWPQLSQESLLLADPQVIILSYGPDGETPDQVRARPSWGSLSAVRDGRVITIDPNLTSRPGPRIVDGLEAMAAALHRTPATPGSKP